MCLSILQEMHQNSYHTKLKSVMQYLYTWQLRAAYKFFSVAVLGYQMVVCYSTAWQGIAPLLPVK